VSSAISLVKVALTLVEATSIPLLILSLIYLITGYQLLSPEIHIIPRPRLIHTDIVLRLITIVVGITHSWAGLTLLCERRVKNKLLKKLLELIIAILVAYIAAFVTLVEASIR